MKSATARKQLWHELSDLFAEDDGSLPEIRLTGLSDRGAVRIYGILRERAAPLEPTQTVWDDRSEREVALSDLPDAAALAATGRIAAIHVVLRGVHSSGVRLPDLGVSVSPGEMALDYRMGSEWDAETLAAFVELLAELQQLDSGVRLAAAAELDLLPEPIQQRLQDAIDRYSASEP